MVNREFIQFLSIAKGSAGELRSQFYRALDVGLLAEKEFEAVQMKIQGISRQLSLFIRYLKNSDLKGYKFSDVIVQYGNDV